jgi:hypothetical protein
VFDDPPLSVWLRHGVQTEFSDGTNQFFVTAKGIHVWALNMLTTNRCLSHGVSMQPFVQIGVSCGKFLDISIQEQSKLRCLHRSIVVSERITKCLHFGFRDRKQIRKG